MSENAFDAWLKAKCGTTKEEFYRQFVGLFRDKDHVVSFLIDYLYDMDPLAPFVDRASLFLSLARLDNEHAFVLPVGDMYALFVVRQPQTGLDRQLRAC